MENRSLKIGIIAAGETSGGGVLQYTQSIIDIVHKDKQNTFILFNFQEEDNYKTYNLETRHLNKPSNIFIRFIRFIQMLLIIRNPLFFSQKELTIFSDIDLYFVTGITAYPHFFLNSPFVFVFHDMQEKYFPRNFSFIERFTRFITNRALTKTSSGIICESQIIKDDIIRFLGVRESKITVLKAPPMEEYLTWPVHEDRFHYIQKKYKLPPKYIFYPAQTWYHKNHLILIEAFRYVHNKLPDVSLIFVGSRKNNDNAIMKKIEDLKMSKSIRHLGYVNNSDMPYLYKLSRMLVLPSLYESISIPVFEAISLGVPVCCSNLAGIKEQIGKAAVFFDPTNSEDISEKILMLIEDEKLRKQKVRLGNDLLNNYNYSGFLKTLSSILTLNN